MTNDTGQAEAFDLSSAFESVFDFEKELENLSGVTVPRTADAMAEAFEQAGGRIEDALSRAARTGQVDFENLVTSILADLARIAANAVFDQVAGGLFGGGQSAPVSVNITMPEGADAGSIISAQGQIAAALGQAVLSGGRWS